MQLTESSEDPVDVISVSSRRDNSTAASLGDRLTSALGATRHVLKLFRVVATRDEGLSALH